MSESESSSRDVVIGISIGLVILAGLYVYLSPDDTSTPTQTANHPAVAQDNASRAKPKKPGKANEATEEPSIRVRKTKDGVFVERTEGPKSDPALYREQSVFERSPTGHLGTRLSREQAANAGALGADASSKANKANRNVTDPNGTDGNGPDTKSEPKNGNQAGSWY